MKLVSLLKSDCDTAALATIVNTCIGVSLGSSTDKILPKMLILLSKMTDNNLSDIEAIKNSDSILKHLHVGYVYVCNFTEAHAVMALSSLEISSFETLNPNIELLIVTGNLQQWRSGIINSTDETNAFFNAVYNDFDARGLSFIFSKYDRKRNKDGSFSLIARK